MGVENSCGLIIRVRQKAKDMGLDEGKVRCPYPPLLEDCSEGNCKFYKSLQENPRWLTIPIRSRPSTTIETQERFYQRLEKWAEKKGQSSSSRDDIAA